MTRYYIAVTLINILLASFFYFKSTNTGLSTKAFIFIGGLSLLIGIGFPLLTGFFDIYVVIGINLLIISLGTYKITQLEHRAPSDAETENPGLRDKKPENTDPAVLVAAAAEDILSDECSDGAENRDIPAALSEGFVEKQAEPHTERPETEEREIEEMVIEEPVIEEPVIEEPEFQEKEPRGADSEEVKAGQEVPEELPVEESVASEGAEGTEGTEGTEGAVAAEGPEIIEDKAVEDTIEDRVVETVEAAAGGEGEQGAEDNTGMLPGQDNTVQGEETMISQQHGAQEIQELIYSYVDRGFDAKTGGKLDLAIKYFSSALDLDPPPDLKKMLVYDLHSMYRELGQYPEAKQCMEDLLESTSGDLSNEEVREIKISIKYVEILQEMLNKANTPNLPYSKLPALIKVSVEGKVDQWLNEAFN